MERKELKFARLSKHWTLAQAAEHLEVDLNTLSRWEQRKTRPHGYNIVKLCQVYGKTSAELGLELEEKQEELEMGNAPLVASLSLPVSPGVVPPQVANLTPQAEAADHSAASAPLSLPDNPPFVSSPTFQSQPRPPRRFRWLRRLAILIAILSVIALSAGIGYSIARVPARGLDQRLHSSLTAGASALPSPTQGTAQEGASPLPTGTAPGKTPVIILSPPAETPGPTEKPIPDCLNGSASHFAFSSLLGLGNTPSSILILTNCGGAAQNWFATTATQNGGNWLQVFPSMGMITANGSESVQIQAAVAGLQVGTYQGSIRFTKGAASWTVTVTFTILQV